MRLTPIKAAALGALAVGVATPLLRRRLTHRQEVDPDRIGAVGLSMGGEEALGAAASDLRIRAVVAEGALWRGSMDAGWLPRTPQGYLERTMLAEQTGIHRAALTMRYLDGLPVPEVARALGRTVTATEALLVRARSAFRKSYVDHDEPGTEGRS